MVKEIQSKIQIMTQSIYQKYKWAPTKPTKCKALGSGATAAGSPQGEARSSPSRPSPQEAASLAGHEHAWDPHSA